MWPEIYITSPEGYSKVPLISEHFMRTEGSQPVGQVRALTLPDSPSVNKGLHLVGGVKRLVIMEDENVASQRRDPGGVDHNILGEITEKNVHKNSFEFAKELTGSFVISSAILDLDSIL